MDPTKLKLVDEFLSVAIRDGVYDRAVVHEALQSYDRKVLYDIFTSREFLERCIELDRQYPNIFGPVSSNPLDMTEEQVEEVDALIDEAEELEERAAQLRAEADALRDAYEYGQPKEDP
jgi:Tat protein secretion system quality control protein TatD with DNase activity